MTLDYFYLTLELSLVVYALYFIRTYKKNSLAKDLSVLTSFMLGCLFVTLPISVLCGCDYSAEVNNCAQVCAQRDRTLQVVKIYEYIVNENVIVNYGE
jgi:hypothetical protein